METYWLVVACVVLVGFMALVVLGEKRRRSDLERFDRLQQAVAQCVQVLQITQANQEPLLTQLRTTVETAARNQTEDTVRAVGEAAVKLQEAALRIEKATSMEIEFQTAKLADTLQTVAKQVSAETRKATEAVEALKASLEESIQFTKP
jgi:hypothetical protein